jgi:hypothetical protein
MSKKFFFLKKQDFFDIPGQVMDYKAIFASLFLWLKEREAHNGGVFSREELATGFEALCK